MFDLVCFLCFQGNKLLMAKWVVDHVTQGDLDHIEQLIKVHAPESGVSFIRRFEDFLSLNRDITDSARLLKGLVGRLARNGLQWSSIETYLRLATSYMRGHGLISVGSQSETTRLSKTVRLLAADQHTQARRVNLPAILNVIDYATTSERLYLYFLAYTGGRWSDIRRLRASQIKVRQTSILIQWRVTKSRRNGTESSDVRNDGTRRTAHLPNTSVR